MRSQLLRSTLATLALLPLAACLPDAPAAPTWSEHVEPILQTNCIRCHGDEPQGGAPPTFRLDVFDDFTVDSQGRSRRGLSVMAPFVGARAGTMGEMPPGGPELNSYQRDVLTNWGEIGLDLTQLAKLRGMRAANRPPTASAQTRFEGDELIVTYEIEDPDRDMVTGSLTLDTTTVAYGRLHAGRGEVRLDASQILPGEYQIGAVVDDGFGGTPTLDLGAVTIAHGNTAPYASIEDTTDLLLTDAAPTFNLGIGVRRCFKIGTAACGVLDEPETHTLEVFAVRGDEEIQILAPTVVAFDPAGMPPVVPDEKRVTFDVNSALLSEGTNWRIRAVVSDGTNSRTTTSAAFIVGHRTTAYTFADVKPLFAKYCEFCHAEDAPLAAPNAGATFMNPTPVEGDLRTPDEIYRDSVNRGDLFRRVVEYQVMPPRSALELVGIPQPTQVEREIIEDWLLGGSPL